MQDSIWKRYHDCKEIWVSWANGGIHFYKLKDHEAHHYRDIVREIEDHWLRENPGKSGEDFEEDYDAWRRRCP